MSLDIYLDSPLCPHCGRKDQHYAANITHNLNTMADALGIYQCVWRPDQNGIKDARQLIEPLKKAIADMRSDPAKYKAFNAPNGWGMYDNFLPWLERLLQACETYPDDEVHVSR